MPTYSNVPIIPGVDEYIRPGIEKLGDTISLFTETDRRTQKAIRNMLIENPDLIQKFADIEYKNPGELGRLGFGNMQDLIKGVGPSPELLDEIQLGPRKREIAKQELDVRGRQLDVMSQQADTDEAKARILQGIIEGNPDLSDADKTEIMTNWLGIKTPDERKLEQLNLDAAQRNADSAKRLQELMDQGEKLNEPMMDYAVRFISGQDNPMETMAILADPIKADQFKLLVDLAYKREAAARTAVGDVPRKITDLPVAMQTQFASISPVRASLGVYAEKVNKFMQLSWGERLAARAGRGAHQKEYGELVSLKNGIMGTLRPLLSPGPLSASDMRMLDGMLSSPLSMSNFLKFNNAPAFVSGQLDGAISYVENKINGMTSIYPTVDVPRLPSSQAPMDLIQMWVDDGFSDQEIIDKLYKMGYDVNSGTTSSSEARPQGISREW